MSKRRCKVTLYEQQRMALIPRAEAYANRVAGAEPTNKRETWANAWNPHHEPRGHCHDQGAAARD